MKKAARSLVLAWIAAAACVRWQPAIAPRQIAAGHHLDQVRVTLRDSSRHELQRAEVRGDSIVGFSGGARASPRRAYALADVAALERGEIDAGRTVAALVLIPAAAWAVSVIVVLLCCCCP